MNLWLTAADLRTYLGTSETSGRYADTPLGSNIRAAQGFLERRTGRQFDVQTATTKLFTTNGEAVVPIPDLASVTSITLQGATLDADETYWLHPDVRHSGVYVNVQLRTFGNDHRSNPEWFDRALDSPLYRYRRSSLPNDLSITGTWGWASKPDDLLLGVKALAAWITKRADAVLAGAVQTPDGSIMDYSRWPEEARAAVDVYRRGEQAVSVG